MYHQALRFGDIALDRDDPQPTPYMLAGRHMYVLGTSDGAFKPIGDEHLVGEMGGFWAHPLRVADGWFLRVHADGGTTRLDDCRSLEGHLSDIVFSFEHGPLAITRTDFVVEHERAVFGLVEVRNTGEQPWRGGIGCQVRLHLRGSWFGGFETSGTRVAMEDHLVVASDGAQPGWGCAFGSTREPSEVTQHQDGDRVLVEVVHRIELASGATEHLVCLLTAEHQNGVEGASACWHKLANEGAALLARKRALYRAVAEEGVVLDVPDTGIVHEYKLAKVNIHMLRADYAPYLPPYLLGGVPEYPQLFGCDSAYSIPGITAAGFADAARSALDVLGDFARRASGRVPHEVTTSGRVWHPGNTQETPQFALAVWDYVRWTGDLDFLRRMYPLCREGVMDYLPTQWDFDGDGYPNGDAMIERHGMGSLKLDSSCYLYAAWFALSDMATTLGRPEAHAYRARTADWRERFERDWWIEDQQLYADSLHDDLRPQLDGHWTQVVPVQLGIASPARALQVLGELERSFVNEHGLVHTRGHEDRVWTLPTGLLALAQLRYGHVDQAVEQLHNIASTTRCNMLGSFEELIPQGICFMQLWSSALFLQGIIEGLLGFEPHAYEHRLRLRPHLPTTWPSATLRHVRVGEHGVTVEIARDHATITHESGSDRLLVEYVAGVGVEGDDGEQKVHTATLAPGESARIALAPIG
jgi:hypothetical protein